MSDNEWITVGKSKLTQQKPNQKYNSSNRYNNQRSTNQTQKPGYKSNYKSNGKKAFTPKKPGIKSILKNAHLREMAFKEEQKTKSTPQKILDTDQEEKKNKIVPEEKALSKTITKLLESGENKPIEILTSLVKVYTEEYDGTVFELFKGKVLDNSRTRNGYGIFNILAYKEFYENNSLSHEKNVENDTIIIQTIFDALHSIGLNVFTVTGLKNSENQQHTEKPEDGIHSMFLRPNDHKNPCPSDVKTNRMRIFYNAHGKTLDMGIRALLSRFAKVDGIALDGFRYFLHLDYKITLDIFINSILAMNFAKLTVIPPILATYCQLLLNTCSTLNNKTCAGDDAFEQFFNELNKELDSNEILNYFVNTIITKSQMIKEDTLQFDITKWESLTGFALGCIENKCNQQTMNIIFHHINGRPRAAIAACYHHESLFKKVDKIDGWNVMLNSNYVQTETAIRFIFMDLFDKYGITASTKSSYVAIDFAQSKYITKFSSKYDLESMCDNFMEDYEDMTSSQQTQELGQCVVEFLNKSPNNEYMIFFSTYMKQIMLVHWNGINNIVESQLNELREENKKIDSVWNYFKNLFKQ